MTNSDIAGGGVKWCGQLGRSFLQSFINLNMYLSYESNTPLPTCLAQKNGGGGTSTVRLYTELPQTWRQFSFPPTG